MNKTVMLKPQYIHTCSSPSPITDTNRHLTETLWISSRLPSTRISHLGKWIYIKVGISSHTSCSSSSFLPLIWESGSMATGLYNEITPILRKMWGETPISATWSLWHALLLGPKLSSKSQSYCYLTCLTMALLTLLINSLSPTISHSVPLELNVLIVTDCFTCILHTPFVIQNLRKHFTEVVTSDLHQDIYLCIPTYNYLPQQRQLSRS